jgi:hypothetical protein
MPVFRGYLVPELPEEVEVVAKGHAHSHRDSVTTSPTRFVLGPGHQRAAQPAALKRRLDRDPPHVKIAVRLDIPPQAPDRAPVHLDDCTTTEGEVVAYAIERLPQRT